jgi:hypothetical protein
MTNRRTRPGSGIWGFALADGLQACLPTGCRAQAGPISGLNLIRAAKSTIPLCWDHLHELSSLTSSSIMVVSVGPVRADTIILEYLSG